MCSLQSLNDAPSALDVSTVGVLAFALRSGMVVAVAMSGGVLLSPITASVGGIDIP